MDVNKLKRYRFQLDLFFMFYSFIILLFGFISLFYNLYYGENLIDKLIIFIDIITIGGFLLSYFFRLINRRPVCYALIGFCLLLYSIFLVSVTSFIYIISVLCFLISVMMIYINYGLPMKVRYLINMIGFLLFFLISLLQALKILPIFLSEIESTIQTYALTFILFAGVFFCSSFLIIAREIVQEEERE